MPGRGNNSVEFQVSLGLQGAKQQIDSLHKALEESVKIDSNGFKGINKMLESAQSQAEKLSSKMGEAFKTSAGSRNFLKDYQKMLETLSQIRSKMGNLGFDDIKFSVQDQNEINDAVKKMQDLEKVVQSIQSGKAINVINNSSVENVDILKKKISDLSIDTSKLTFDNLKVRLSDAAEEASSKLAKTEEKINNIDSVIKKLDASGLQEIQSKISTSTGLSTKLIDDKSIDEANRKLRELTEQFNGLSDKTKSNLQVNQKTGDIGNFIQKQTENIKAEYQKQIEAIRTSKEAINKAMQSIDTSGHKGKNGQTYYNTQELTELVNSEAMKTQIDALGINLTELFKNKTIAQQISALKEALTKGLESLTIKEDDLTNLRNSFEQALQGVFTNLTASSVSNVKAVKDKITETLGDIGVKAVDLKNFGFDINKISAGETLASVYDRLKNAIDQYVVSLHNEQANLSSKELVERQTALEELQKAQKAADETQTQSGDVVKTLQEQITECSKKIEELVQQYNQLTGKKVEINLGNTKGEIEGATKAIENNITAMSALESKQKALSNVQSAVTRWMGFYQVLNLTKRAINDMKQHVQELDTVMTKIAVVTNMTQNDLWNQIGTYSEIARQYGVAIKGVYEVSQIYYQQGLNKGDVMGLTTETLKMARIAGIDYATAADYMTTAVRGFKLEMSDAAHVTDVFSNLAAHTASSTEELAVAISKTAASAASVGASFESTSAMMATMIATTRESATNIGTALKSIIARYGELKENMTGTDAEGEEYSLNKVDKALQSVGISIHDAAGQFRDFDDVILELAESWDTIDKNTQRYIATVMAGNRQQSRFLALVSNVEEYKRALELANNSDNAGELQVLKTLDSVDAKIERMKVTIQEFYTSSGIQDLYKNILDTITNVISAANDLPKMFGNLPVTAIAVGLQIVAAIKNVLILVILQAQNALERIKLSGKNAFSSMATDAGKAGQTAGKNFRTNFEAQMAMLQGSGKSLLSRFFSTDAGKYVGHIASTLLSTGAAGLSLSATNAYGASRSSAQDQSAAQQMFGSAALNGLSGLISGTLMGGPWVGALNGIANLLPSLISGISMNQVTLAREIELQTKVANESKQQATLRSGEVKELETARDKLEKLKNTSIESAEAMQEYKDYMNQLADTYPELISRIELTGDKTIILADLEEKLAEARIDSAKATIQSLQDEVKLKESKRSSYQKLLSENGLPSTIESDSADFSFLEEYIWTWGSSEQKAALDRGDKYAALLDLYNTYAKNNGLKQHAKENLDWMNGGANRNVVYSNLSDFNNLQNALLNNDRSEGIIRRKLKDNLSTFLDENKDSGITLSELTDGTITELSDLDNNELKTQDLIDIIHSITEQAQNHIDSMTESIEGIKDTLNQAELQLAVDTNIGTQRINGKPLSNYSSFITSMMGYQFGKGYDWTSKEGQAQAKTSTDQWITWLEKNTDNADWLMQNLNFTSIRDSKGLIDLLSSHGIKQENVGQDFLDNIIDEFNKTRENVQDAYQESLKTIFNVENWVQLSDLKHYDLYKLFNNNISEHDNLELDQQLAENLQKNLYEYKKLIDNDQQILAENYLIGLENSFKIIGSYNNEQQDAIQSIIESVDWSDSTSLSSAAESLRNIGPEYEELAHELDLASERFATNITTRVMQLRDSAATTIKSIEKVMDNVGTVTKSSDALENVNTMLASYTGEDKETLDFTSIYEWNKELNGYVLTEKGIQVWLDSINEKNTEELKKAENQLKELKSLYGEQQQQGTIYSAEQGLDRDTVLEAFKAAYTDEQGKLTIDEDTLNARTDAFMAEYEDLRTEFSKQTDLSWEQFIDKKKEALILTNEKEIENLKNMPYQEIVSQIASIDYKSIAGGTATQGTRETLEALLKEAGVTEDRLGAAFNDIWTKMLAGDFESFNNLLTEFNIDATVSNKDAFVALQEEYQQYSEGLSEILTKPALAWSDKTKEIANITDETNLDTIDTGAIAIRFLQRIADLVGLGAATIEDQEQAIINVMNQRDKEAGIGRQKQLFNAIKDGFTNDEIVKLGGTDADGNIKQELKDLIEKDETTGEFKVVAKGTTAEILQQFADALDITLDTESEAYKEALSSGTDEAIAEANKNDEGKQIASTLSSIASASVGTRVKASSLSPELKKALGVSANGIYEVMSEYKRDQALLALNANDLTDPESQTQLRQIQKDINSKYSKSNGLKGIMSSVVDADSMRSFIQNNIYPNIDISNWTDEDIQTSAYNRGYIWDEYTQSYKATIKALDIINQQIKDAIASGTASPETIADLRKQAADLEQELTHDKKRDALANLLTNYQDAESALSDFYAQFGTGFSKDELKQKGILTTDAHGKEVIDIDKLNEVVDGYDDLFKTAVEQRADDYIANAEKAGQLFTQGTTSQIEMAGFKEAYNQLTGAEVEFIFDPLLQAWTIDIINLRTYLSSVAKTMNLSVADQQSWVDNQIKTLVTDNLDFSGYLSGTNTVKENNILRKNLTDYFKDKSRTKGFLSQDDLDEWIKQQIDTTFDNLSKGGQAAINALKSIKGELTQDEVEAVYRAQIAPLKALSDQLDDLQVGSVVAKNQIDALNAAGFKVNADGVVTSTGDLVEAYKSLYDQMKATNEATIAELNTAMGKYLDSRDGEQVVIDALSNAANMTYSQLADIYTQAGIELTESMVDQLEAAGVIKGLGGNKMMITDFKTFAKLMNWNADSEEYLSAFNAYNDAFVNMNRQYESEILAEAKSVTEAKVGDKINLTYLTDAITKNAPDIARELDREFYELGATFKDGLLTINSGANIPGIMARIYEYSEKYGNLLPEELAELADAVAEFLANITSLITKGITSGLTRAEATNLSGWAREHGIDKLDFIETADGLKLANDSAKELYHVMNQLDSLQGSVVFETLKDNLIETDERFKSATSNAAYIKEIESRGLTQQDQSFLSSLNGNVDVFNRPILQNEDGTISTLLTTTEDSRNYESEIPWVMNISPITPEGKKLDDQELQSYIQHLIEETGGDMGEMIKLDKKELGLVVEGENTEIEQQDKILEKYDARAEKLHLIGEQIEKNKDASAEELALAQKMAEARGLSQDDSFKFMDQAIPDAQNNPLNYWENWGKAYKAMNEASKTGKMDYSAFYNLVTEMGNLAAMTGKAIPLGEQTVRNAETAAALIEKAAGALQVQADGSIKIDLSKIGVDFVSGADKMNANIEDGIHQVAQSQIDMLDSLIGLLEAIVTMEDAFKQFNVDSDMDMQLDFDEIFAGIDVDDDGTIDQVTGFADNWQHALEYLRDRLDPTKLDTYSEDFARGAESIKFAINGMQMSLADLIKADFDDLGKYGFTPENLNIYQKIMQGIYDAIQSGDFTETNVKELIMQKLQDNLGDNGDIVFDMGNYTFIGSGGMQFSIDWDSDNTKAALEQFDGILEQKQKQLTEAFQARGKNEAKPIQYQATLIADGTVKIEDGKGKLKIEGKEYTYDANHPERVARLFGAAELDKLGAKGIKWQNDSPLAATGTLKMGQRNVKVEATDKGKINYVADDGTKYDSPSALVEGEVDKAWKAKMDEKGITDDKSDEAQNLKKQVKYDVEVQYGISTFALNSQSYQGLDEQIKKDLEAALKSGNQAQIDAVIDANVELAELKGLSSSEIEEKLGLKEIKIKFDGDTTEATTALTTLQTTADTLANTQYEIQLNHNQITEATIAAQTLIEKLNQLGAIKTPTVNQPQSEPQPSGRFNPNNLTASGGVSDVGGSRQRKEINGIATDTANAQNQIEQLNATKISPAVDVEEAKAGVQEIVDLYGELTTNSEASEIKIDQDLMTNDTTKAQLDSINELLTNVKTNPNVEIVTKMSSDSDARDKIKELTDLIETLEDYSPVTIEAEFDEDDTKRSRVLDFIQTLKELDDMHPIIDVDVDPEGTVIGAQIPPITQAISDLDALSPVIDVNVNDQATSVIGSIKAAVDALSGKTITITTNYVTTGTPPSKGGPPGGATGNVGLAHAQGTLMGELGPELVVSNGRYFVAGQNGAEFVDLAKDAIVFNHLQTEQLLQNGMSKERGRAVTNERNAVAFAQGNINGGPALASAKAVLAQLKQLRAMWQSMLGSSVKDLAGLGGSGGGGGGGASPADPAAFAAFVREVERWYDYLQEIATLEEKINREEAKREKYQSSFLRAGKEYAQSNLETLKYLREEAVTHQALADAQQEYFDKRRKELNTQGAFKDLYTFDENGQLKYNPDLDKNGQRGGLAFLADLLKRDDKGKSKYSLEQQYNILSKYWGDQMKYDSSGNEIVLKADATEDDRNTFYANSVQALFDLIDSQQAEMQSLHDSINEHELAVIENQTAANEIMQEIEDNQISVEDKVLDAVISQREQEIDDAQKTRDAIEEASNHLIDGLNTQLDKEREMYDTQNGQQELSRLQSQLAILRSSGGSGSEIANLQKEIASRQKDMYFEAQEQQIAALQEASQNELDRLDAQIDLMNETLEYEKENGLLWNYVYQVMAGTSEEITNFILTYDKQYWGQSPTRDTQTYRQTLFEVDQMIGYKEGMSNGFDEVVQGFSDYAIKKDAEIKNGDKNAEKNATSKAEDYHNTHLPAAPDNSGGSGGSNSGGSSPGGGGGGKKVVATSYQDAGNSGHKVHVVYSDGTSSEKLEAHNWDKKVVTGGTKTCYCSKCNHYMGVVYPGSAHFSQGGMIDYTGPAMVHGSKSKPESVLNAEQTKILRDNILSNKPNSLISLLQAYNNGYDSNALVPTTGESIIIEQATVEMNVAQISNDYDAQRAGEQALERMVQIARKSQRQNRVGR